MIHLNMVEVAILADDLTEAMDSGAQLVRAGYRTAVAFHGAMMPPMPELDAVAVDTDSRPLDPETAGGRVRETARRLGDARIFYKKLDSTLRGPITAELEAALEGSGHSRAIVAPAFPSNGRTTRDGVQLLHDVPLHETSLSAETIDPVRESHIPSLLAAGGLTDVGTLRPGELEDPGRARNVLEGRQWIVVDATEDAHLKALVKAVPDPSQVMWAGSAGLVAALGEVHPGPGETIMTSVSHPASGTNLLTVAGSTNRAVRGQLRYLDEETATALVPLSSDRLADGDTAPTAVALRACRELLGDAVDVALYSTDDEIRPGGARSIVKALANMVAVLSEEGLFDALVLTGGDTAVHVARSLGARGILLEGEIEPGVPVGTLMGDRPYRVITKAGGFGSPETLFHALNVLKGKDRKL